MVTAVSFDLDVQEMITMGDGASVGEQVNWTVVANPSEPWLSIEPPSRQTLLAHATSMCTHCQVTATSYVIFFAVVRCLRSILPTQPSQVTGR